MRLSSGSAALTVTRSGTAIGIMNGGRIRRGLENRGKMTENSNNLEIMDADPEVNALTNEWVKVDYDTGAGVTAFPVAMAGTSSPATGTMYKTASGERVGDFGAGILTGADERGVRRSLSGRYSEVHRILASGGSMASEASEGRQDRT